MVDLHCHILPNIDDGSKNMEETLKMGRISEAEGFSKIIATPHYIEGEFTLEREKFFNIIEEVNICFVEEGIDIEVLPGSEVYISPNLPSKLKNGEIFTLNNTSYVLIEFPMGNIPIYTQEILYEMRLLGYRPVIAHPERYTKVMEDPDYLKGLIEQGNYVQINSLSVTGILGKRAKQTAEILLKHKMVHFIGTDAHTPGVRSPRIKRALEQMCQWVDNEYVGEIINNGKVLIKDEEVLIPQPLVYKSKKGFLHNIKKSFILKTY
ncbi:MAG TPA: CpsB/CapC family capsule biosynthesis tyrosine phosphatase [Oscillospiraceae bacterium]|nr:CpsB/CapC family capsule biosynthesis tyrosine phosphatase [Oscillospiraceae bacterium]